MARPRRMCTIPGCDHFHFGHGICRMHYARLKKHGDPTAGRTPEGALLKFIHEVALAHESDDCLIWPFGRRLDGYCGFLCIDGKRVLASRYICAQVHGDPPSKRHEAAHLCGNGHLGCVSPLHLVWKTPAGNRADKAIHKTIRGPEAVAILGGGQ